MDFSKKAVALKYDFHGQDAPLILAKGTGFTAKLVLDAAREAKIPLKEDPLLANALYQLPLLSEIPEALYNVIAALYIELIQADSKFV